MGARGRTNAGMGLGTTLMVVSLALLLVLTLTASQWNTLNFSARVGNAQHALNLAESAVSLAIARILAEPEFGAEDLEQSTILATHPHAPRDATGWLTFDPGTAANRDGPYSTNNLRGDSAVPGSSGTVVPSATIYLVGVGECGGVRKTVEAMIHLPRFPYSIASSGTVVTSGEVLVAAAASPEALGVALEDLLPGNLAANASAEQAVVLAPGAVITGDVASHGGVEVASGNAVVMGEVRAYSDRSPLPRLPLESYDPAGLEGIQVQRLRQGTLEAPALSGFVRRQGDLSIRGGLTMDSAVLFVDGGLVVEGGIWGKGAVFATGPVSVHGGSDLSSDNLAAVVSGGDVSFTGTGPEGSYFQGLVYSEGDVLAQQVSLFGALIANAPQGSRIQLEDARLIHVPEHTSLELQLEDPLGTPFFFTYHGAKFSGAGAPKGNSGPKKDSVPVYVRRQPDGTFVLFEPVSNTRLTGLTSQGVADAMVRLLSGMTCKKHGASRFPETETELLQAVRGMAFPQSPAARLKPARFTLDASRFVAFQDQMRIMYWRER
ncbi:MAG: hypothetical protein HY319_09270 [Armatimonadetes bacterium]|nr:hypothetical protein [Armatimonadota bacterium]